MPEAQAQQTRLRRRPYRTTGSWRNVRCNARSTSRTQTTGQKTLPGLHNQTARRGAREQAPARRQFVVSVSYGYVCKAYWC
ncbi:hypothetical protein NDU88_002187 [Pleurodeles waltl]|uniref:Uncharacterized protein n=1 Tax=Pleurodeles waltl TaxID=8319 RepID=A0AAV7TJU6_PLEWA|nr:hypothetical protein NDU88_002187 [Pleurodeles waltl]